MFFTPGGRYEMVIAERRRRIDFRDAHNMELVQSLPVKCKGVDHLEFTVDGRYAIATCEFSGQLVKIDLASRTVAGHLSLGTRASNPLKKVARILRRRHGDHG